MMFPIWFLKLIVFGGLLLCAAGAVLLIVFLICDSRKNRIW
ncbi:hypothetical protein CA51_18890 [Rosistilla oblonga]|uniref:Uncharacterized protein n=1 Tax=Rosistilla oblonga TaxID=2527990 RepID=A0A518ISC8_9BACT|nr:hypothetical protein CA51_18890 [Rosistilla oblonga]QDV55963.1 hypothetical protein Mal33_19420 [Rosistilla oblonga]